MQLDKGITLIFDLEAISEADKKGKRTVHALLNGQIRPVRVRDNAIKAEVASAERADATKPGHVSAPFAGAVTVSVHEGDQVTAGDTVATIEAMKMEASITASVTGTVERVVVATTTQLEGGDLLLVIKPE